MFGEKKFMTPPVAHAASNKVPSWQRQHLPPSGMDLSVVPTQQQAPPPSSSSFLRGITAPPAVPPLSSKFWDTPPPSFTHLQAGSSATVYNSSSHHHGNGSKGGVQFQPPAPMPMASSVSSLSAASASASQIISAVSSGGCGGINHPVSKYAQLLAVIEEMGKEVRPCYTGSKASAERLKRAAVYARILVRECLVETERSARAN